MLEYWMFHSQINDDDCSGVLWIKVSFSAFIIGGVLCVTGKLFVWILMWGALSRLFVKNENPSLSDKGDINETMDKQASHQDMDTLESKQVRLPLIKAIKSHINNTNFMPNSERIKYFSVDDFVTYLIYHLQFPCKYYFVFVVMFFFLLSVVLYRWSDQKLWYQPIYDFT